MLKPKSRLKAGIFFNLIPTALPLVYRRGNVLTVENGLNLNRKHELRGIQLLSGVMVALQRGPGNNISSATWKNVKRFAETMTFNGKQGFLPSKNALKEHWGTEEQTKLAATVKVLKENEIEADGYQGCIWCSEVYDCYNACFFGLRYGGKGWCPKTYINKRIAVAFS
jgi:hypothetical protein